MVTSFCWRIAETRALASTRIKTVSIRRRSPLLRTDPAPRSYLAPRSLSEVRKVLRIRVQLVRLRSAIKNCIHALLASRGLFQRGKRSLWTRWPSLADCSGVAVSAGPCHRRLLFCARDDLHRCGRLRSRTQLWWMINYGS
jgi:hypothetical protein